MSDEAPEKSGKMWFYVVGMLVGVPLCYVLSTGPMVVLQVRKIVPESAILAIYAPLSWFMRETNTREAINSYVLLWLKLTNTPIP